MVNKYIGITIGPIVDTITLTSTPAGLWGASYLFSYISKNICEDLINNGVFIENFVTPYFEMENGKIKRRANGVGLFHDRIVFRSNCGDMGKVQESIDKVKKHIGEKLAKETCSAEKVVEYIKDYFQIYAVECNVNEDENPILKVSKPLDCLELQKSFVKRETENYILSHLVSKKDDGGRNEAIKKSFMLKDSCESIEKWELIYDNANKIKTIEDIAKGKADTKTMKKHHYYAIVQADGDNMGKVLSNLKGDEEIRKFSRACLEYGATASEIIHMYKGVTIYAGGDDLLFIAPLDNETENIFKLLKDIEEKFKEVFSEYISKSQDKEKPSLSFGVSVCYEKYPLYEALEKAIDLLFGTAKCTDTKNTTAINFQKHSGQSFGLIIENTGNNKSYEKVCELLSSTWVKEDRDEFLKSVSHKILTFRELFKTALKENDESLINNIFDNTFDSEIHKGEKGEYISEVRDILKLINEQEKKEISSMDKNAGALETIDSILRMLKFFTEKGREN